jgi:transposase
LLLKQIFDLGERGMHLKTILNRVYRHKGFVYQSGRFVQEEDGRERIEVGVEPRRNGRAVCSGCGRRRAGYDRLGERRYQMVPVLGFAVYLVYRPRRVECRCCGVKVEQVPWAKGKETTTQAFQWYLVFWTKYLALSRVAEIFRTNWHTVYEAVERAVEWGLARRRLDNVRSIGIDEVQWRKGHHYLTLVYQLDAGCRRLLYVGLDRTADSLRGFFSAMPEQLAGGLQYVCSDMWRPYLEVLKQCAGQAVHVLDRYHIVAKLNKAIDEVRAGEAQRMKASGHDPVLKHSRWCLLKRPENLSAGQGSKLRELLRFNLKTVRAYLLKEEFQQLWEYVAPGWAGHFLAGWLTKALRSRIEPMKKVARTLRKHRALILNWFKARGEISAGIVEGQNYNVKLMMRRSYGVRTYRAMETLLYHQLGDLPVSELAHRFV